MALVKVVISFVKIMTSRLGFVMATGSSFVKGSTKIRV